jgi:hypothetical protein
MKLEKDFKPVHLCPFTVPRIVEQKLHTDITRLVDIEVPEEDYIFA